MSERRKFRRQLRSMEARIGYAGSYRLRCLVLNISPDGAKLALKPSANLPTEFILSISGPGAQREYWARVRWRSPDVFEKYGIKTDSTATNQDESIFQQVHRKYQEKEPELQSHD